MPPPWGDSGGPNPSVILTIFTNAWHKAMLFLWKTHTWAIWPLMGDSGGPNYGTNRHTNGGYPGSAASELSSALPEVTSDASELSSGASEVSSVASEFSSDAPEHRSDAS